jgi:Concanavalin A-like lectin/glucanases superfamily
MICDVLRSCYRRDCVFTTGGSDPLQIRWYRCPPNAKPLPIPSRFASLNWSAWPWEYNGVGEQFLSRPSWFNGATPPSATGQFFCGRPEWFLSGQPYDAVSPPAQRDAFGLLVCCSGLDLPAAVDQDFALDFAVNFARNAPYTPGPRLAVGPRVSGIRVNGGTGTMSAAFKFPDPAVSIRAGPAQIRVAFRLPGSPVSSLLNGLLAWWGLHESAGSVRVDSSGNGHDLVEQASPVNTTPGLIGTAALFAINSYLGTAGALPAVFPFTVSLWEAPQGGVSGFVFGQDGSHFLTITEEITTQRSELLPNSVQTMLTSTSGTWYHLLVTYDNVALKIWKNGVLIASAPGAGAFITASNTFVGGINAFLNCQGAVQLVGVWDRVLNSAEIAALYNSGTGSDYPFI